MNFLDLFNKTNQKEILQNLPDAAIVVEASGLISWANDKAMTVFEADKSFLLNHNFEDLVDSGRALAEKSATRRTPVIAGAFTPNAREFFIEMNAVNIDGQYIITIRDVTAMTKVLVEAEKTGRLNKEKNLMLVKLSNEIKSPIQSIIGFSQALIDGLGGEINEKQNKYAQIINKNSSELLYFMDKLLEFSLAESSLFVSDFQVFDVINAMQTVIKNNELLFLNKNLAVNFEKDSLPKRAIYSDESALKTTLQNLIEVAVKSTEVGSINIMVSNPELDLVRQSGLDVPDNATEKSYLLITMTDTGAGLGEHELDGLFEPYTQLDKANKKNVVRSISLGTANTLTKRLKGSIWAESEVSKGTKYNLIIPIEKVAGIENE